MFKKTSTLRISHTIFTVICYLVIADVFNVYRTYIKDITKQYLELFELEIGRQEDFFFFFF